jgi:hypothetical protein
MVSFLATILRRLLKDFIEMLRQLLMNSATATGAGLAPVELSTSLLTTDSSQTNGTAFVTASVSPFADRLITVAVSSTAVSSGDNAAPTLAGNGLTWVQVDTAVTKTNWGRVTLFRSMGAAPTTGAVTITFSDAQNDCLWEVREWADVDTGGTNGSAAIAQSANNRNDSATSLTATLGAFSSANNATYGVFGRTS